MVLLGRSTVNLTIKNSSKAAAGRVPGMDEIERTLDVLEQGHRALHAYVADKHV